MREGLGGRYRFDCTLASASSQFCCAFCRVRSGLYAGLWPTLLRDSFYSGAVLTSVSTAAAILTCALSCAFVHMRLCTGMSIVTYTRCKSLFAELLRQPTQAFSVQFLTGTGCCVCCVLCALWAHSVASA
jgi:hypothetical protein